MGPGFSGEAATYYARYRRGYPPAAMDAIAEAFALTTDDLVVDLGCGSGQLSLPLAARVRTVGDVGAEPTVDLGLRRQSGTLFHWVATVLPSSGRLLGRDIRPRATARVLTGGRSGPGSHPVISHAGHRG
jgi:hypothetical protein